MEELKKYLIDNICFDDNDDKKCIYLNETIFDELDRLTIYNYDCKKFFNIDPEKVLHLATMEFFTIDSDTTIEDIAREALKNLAFNYCYEELEKNYKKVQSK